MRKMEQRKTYLLKFFFVFCGILIICKVEAEISEKEQTQEITSAQNKILPPKLGQNAYKRVVDVSSLNSISQDIEVFKKIVGPQKENQEEEGEAEAAAAAEADSETQPEAEEPKDEAAADETVAEEAVKEEVAETENEPAAEEEPKVAADGAAEPEPADEQEAAKESEPEVQPPSSKETDESEMPNDEPAKEEEPKRGKNDVREINKNGTSCFACTNSEDVKCSTKPTKQVTCKIVNEGDKGKHNGCYTLYQVDTNTTMRGCVDDLAEDGLKYCLTHAEFCNLCYSNDCNFKMAPSAANYLQLNVYSSLLFFATSFFVIIKKI